LIESSTSFLEILDSSLSTLSELSLSLSVLEGTLGDGWLAWFGAGDELGTCSTGRTRRGSVVG